MNTRTQDDRIILIQEAEEKGNRYVALPCDDFGWEVKDLESKKCFIPGDTFQRAIAECVATILNDTQKGDQQS